MTTNNATITTATTVTTNTTSASANTISFASSLSNCIISITIRTSTENEFNDSTSIHLYY